MLSGRIFDSAQILLMDDAYASRLVISEIIVVSVLELHDILYIVFVSYTILRSDSGFHRRSLDQFLHS